jgi:type VI secretion system FHA domain protein
MNQALRVFLEGAGMPHKELSPAQSERLLHDCGAVLRAAVEGLMMLLIARGELRKEFEAEERTMVAARDNNPLKLMADPHEAMQFILDPTDSTGGFLDPVRAIGDACEDLRAHELALMAGMRAAFQGALKRFAPEFIEREADKQKGSFSLNKKIKLWDAFVAHHEKLTRDAEDDLLKVFGREFLGTYMAQVRKLRSGR